MSQPRQAQQTHVCSAVPHVQAAAGQVKVLLRLEAAVTPPQQLLAGAVANCR
jgi:hypothetical protein